MEKQYKIATPEEVELIQKKLYVMKLALATKDQLVVKFLDVSSFKMLDEKIAVFTALIENRPVSDEDYYRVLENYPDPAKFGEHIISILWD